MPFIHKPLKRPLPELDSFTLSNGRLYHIPSGLCPSITTVLGILNEESLEKWRSKIGREKAQQICDDAAERGDKLHSVIERYLKNEPLGQLDNRIRPLFNRVRLNLNRINNIIAQEIPLYSEELCIAGRCDCIAEYDGVLSIIDFKSSLHAKPEDWILGYKLQCTAYAKMFEELTSIEISQYVVIISGEGKSNNPKFPSPPSSQVFMGDAREHLGKLRDVINQYSRTGAVERLVEELETQHAN